MKKTMFVTSPRWTPEVPISAGWKPDCRNGARVSRPAAPPEASSSVKVASRRACGDDATGITRA